MMRFSLELTETEAERLRLEAHRLGVSPEALVRALLADLLGSGDDDFQRASAYVLRKNEELYRRLA